MTYLWVDTYLKKTLACVQERFSWPGISRDVEKYCRICPTCQRSQGRTWLGVPLSPMPLIDQPFERIGLDIIGPLRKSEGGHTHILVVVDYATRYPEEEPETSGEGDCIYKDDPWWGGLVQFRVPKGERLESPKVPPKPSYWGERERREARIAGTFVPLHDKDWCRQGIWVEWVGTRPRSRDCSGARLRGIICGVHPLWAYCHSLPGLRRRLSDLELRPRRDYGTNEKIQTLFRNPVSHPLWWQ